MQTTRNELAKSQYFKNMRRVLDNNHKIIYEAKPSLLPKV